MRKQILFFPAEKEKRKRILPQDSYNTTTSLLQLSFFSFFNCSRDHIKSVEMKISLLAIRLNFQEMKRLCSYLKNIKQHLNFNICYKQASMIQIRYEFFPLHYSLCIVILLQH